MTREEKLFGLFIFVYVVAVLLAAGCETVTEFPMSEPAVISDVIYQPDTHGSGIGLTLRGDVAVTSVDTPAVYAVVFECPHGKFIIQGSDKKHRALWQKLKRGQRVIVDYFELRREDGTIAGYKFRGAEVVP